MLFLFAAILTTIKCLMFTGRACAKNCIAVLDDIANEYHRIIVSGLSDVQEVKGAPGHLIHLDGRLLLVFPKVVTCVFAGCCYLDSVAFWRCFMLRFFTILRDMMSASTVSRAKATGDLLKPT